MRSEQEIRERLVGFEKQRDETPDGPIGLMPFPVALGGVIRAYRWMLGEDEPDYYYCFRHAESHPGHQCIRCDIEREDFDSGRAGLAMMGQFISEGLIHEVEEGHWTLTDRGMKESDRLMSTLTHRQQSLMLMRVATIQRRHENDGVL